MLISIISPCRNEVAHIDAYLAGALTQECNGFELEILVADGLSDDGTVQKLDEWRSRDPRLKVIANPGQIVSTGLNLALHEAHGDVIVRMDIHTTYAPDYVAECVKALQETGATCVGGPWIAKGHTPTQQAIAAAFQSRIGSGGAASRRADYSGWVDTVYLGAWRRDDLLRLCGFDETLVRNQDDELSLRILRQGGRIWQSSTIHSTYIPRPSLTALYRQFSQYGYWKIPVITKHRLPASPRHVAPFAFFAVLTMLSLAAPLWAPAAWALATLILLYLGALVAGTRTQRAALDAKAPGWLTVASVATMHIGYAYGFGRAIWDHWVLRRGSRHAMNKLTR